MNFKYKLLITTILKETFTYVFEYPERIYHLPDLAQMISSGELGGMYRRTGDPQLRYYAMTDMLHIQFKNYVTAELVEQKKGRVTCILPEDKIYTVELIEIDKLEILNHLGDNDAT